MPALSELSEPRLMLELIMGSLRARDVRLNAIAEQLLIRAGGQSVPRLVLEAADAKNKPNYRVRALEVVARIGPPYGLEMLDLSVLLHARNKSVREAARKIFTSGDSAGIPSDYGEPGSYE